MLRHGHRPNEDVKYSPDTKAPQVQGQFFRWRLLHDAGNSLRSCTMLTPRCCERRFTRKSVTRRPVSTA
jgi:hypothetical protein